MLTTCFNAFVLNVFLLIESKQNLFFIIQTICFSSSCIFDFSILRNPRVFWVNILVIVQEIQHFKDGYTSFWSSRT